MSEPTEKDCSLGDARTIGTALTYTTSPCAACGETTDVQLNVADLAAWRDGAYAQDVWPDMATEDRELLISGTHPSCWVDLFGEEA